MKLMQTHFLISFTGPEERNIKPHAEKGKKPPQFEKKENATLKQRIEILDWHHAQGPKQKQGKTAQYWDARYPNLQLKQPIISDWLKKEEKFRQQYAETLARGHTGDAKRARQTENPEVTEMLELWIAKAMSDDIALSGEIIRQKWKRFADLVGVPEDERLALSDGWLAGVKKRCGLKNYKRHGEAGSAKAEDVAKERERVSKVIAKHKFQLKDIFNMDETGLYWA